MPTPNNHSKQPTYSQSSWVSLVQTILFNGCCKDLFSRGQCKVSCLTHCTLRSGLNTFLMLKFCSRICGRCQDLLVQMLQVSEQTRQDEHLPCSANQIMHAHKTLARERSSVRAGTDAALCATQDIAPGVRRRISRSDVKSKGLSYMCLRSLGPWQQKTSRQGVQNGAPVPNG